MGAAFLSEKCQRMTVDVIMWPAPQTGPGCQMKVAVICEAAEWLNL